jgi:predicted amidohydrolase
MQVVLVQQASALDPAENRARLESLVPEGADLVVLPEAFARDFGEPGSDLSAYAEPLDGPFVTEVERVAKHRDTTVVAGMFETAGDTPYNTVVVRGRAQLDYRKIHHYDSVG